MWDRAALIVCIGVAAAIATTFSDYGLGWDDYTHSQMGELLLALYGSGFKDQRAFSFVNLYMYGGGFDMAAALAAKVLPFGLFETRRLLGGLVGLVGLAITWRLARRVAGPRAGFFALTLLATCPLYYGHMFINAKDAPFAVAMIFLTYTLVRLYEAYPRPPWRVLGLFALALGASIGTRVMGGVAALFVVLPQLLVMKADFDRAGVGEAFGNTVRFVSRAALGLPAAYVVMGVLWPWSVLSPLNPFVAIHYFEHFFEKPWRELFNGTLILVPDMPWTYLPVLFAVKLPELFIVATLVGAGLAILQTVRGAEPPHNRARLLVVLGAAFAPILLAIVTRPALYNGLRHFLFVVPPMAVLGGLGADWLFLKAQSARRSLRIAATVLLAAGIVSPAIEIARLHPYEYVHFNHLAGGVEGARGRFMVDYWGLSFKQAAHDLRVILADKSPPDGKKWKIAICGPHRPAQVELGDNFEATWDSRGADIALTLGEYYCRDLQAPVLLEVRHEGVLFARAYDIRGHQVPTLLTIPPPQ